MKLFFVFGFSAFILNAFAVTNYIGLLYNSPVYSNGYFVDSINGDDSNSGLLPSAPLKSISSIPTMASGMTVWLTNNGFWRGSIVVSKDNTSYDSYGTGAMPILDCSDVVTQTWTKTSSLTNTYQFSLTFDPVSPGSTFLGLWENSNRLARAAGLTNCDATASTYWVTNDTASPSTMFVHGSVGGSPSTNGATYETATRWIAFDGWASGVLTNITVRNILCRRNLDVSGSIAVGGSSYNCWAVDGNKHNFLCAAGSYVEGLVCSNWNYGAQGGTPGVAYSATGNGQNTTFTNCTFISAPRDAQATGLISHSDTGFFGTFRVLNCKFYNLGEAIFPNCRYLIVSGCTISNVTDGIDSDNYSLLMTNTSISASSHAVLLDGGQVSSNVVSSCTMTNPTNSYNLFIVGSVSTVLVENSTFGGNTAIFSSSTNAMKATITSRTNTFNNSVNWQIQTTNQAVSDYNSYSLGSLFLSADAFSGNYMSFLIWKPNTGQDPHSTNP